MLLYLCSIQRNLLTHYTLSFSSLLLPFFKKKLKNYHGKRALEKKWPLTKKLKKGNGSSP